MSETKPGNPYGVLVAGPEDEDDIISHIYLLHRENGMWPLSEAKVLATVRSATRGEGREKRIIGLIKGEKGKLEGSICLQFSECYYSDWWHWSELWNYVHIEHRRSKHAKNLLGFAKWCSDTMSESLIGTGSEQTEVPLVVGILTLDHLEAKMRLYQRVGLQQVGAYFMHRGVPPGAYNQRRLNDGQ